MLPEIHYMFSRQARRVPLLALVVKWIAILVELALPDSVEPYIANDWYVKAVPRQRKRNTKLIKFSRDEVYYL